MSSRAVTRDGVGYRLRPLQERDTEALSAFYDDERYWRYLMEGYRTPTQVAVFLEEAISQTDDPNGTETWWGIDHPDSGALIGTANIKRIGDLSHRYGSAGMTLGPSSQGQGLGKTLSWDMMRLAFEIFDLHRLELTCGVENEVSLHLMRDVFELTYEGVRRDHAYTSRGWWSSHVFSILEDEYHAREKSKFLAR